MTVILNEVEQRLARFLAKKRYEHNRNSGTQNRKIGEQSDEETDLNGIGAEIAFCKMFNVYPDLQLDCRPAEDAILSDGRKVDVKTTRYKSGKLIVVPWKKPDVDVFALMIGEFPEYRFCGVKSCDEVLKSERLSDLGYGPSYCVEQCELELITT